MLEFIPSRFYIHAFTIPWLVFGHDLFGKSTSSTQVVFCIALKCCILFLLFKQLFRQAHHWHHFCISIWSFSGPLCFNIFSSISCLNDFLSTFQWTSSAASLLTYLQSGMKHQVTLVVLHNREDISATSRIYTLGYPSETRN